MTAGHFESLSHSHSLSTYETHGSFWEIVRTRQESWRSRTGARILLPGITRRGRKPMCVLFAFAFTEGVLLTIPTVLLCPPVLSSILPLFRPIFCCLLCLALAPISFSLSVYLTHRSAGKRGLWRDVQLLEALCSPVYIKGDQR